MLNEDGTPADDYLDVSSSGFVNLTDNDEQKGGLMHAKNGIGDNAIDIDFATDLTASTFCYVFCFYDDNGNISAPTEVCVEIESWAGYSALEGVWSMTKYVQDGALTVDAGEFQCSEEYEQYCANGETFMASFSCTSIDIELIMDENGDFQLTQDYLLKYLDVFDSEDACAPVFAEVDDISGYFEGKWAYDEEEQVMTLVIFNGVSAGVSMDNENGTLGYNGTTIVSANDLQITVPVTDLFGEEVGDIAYYFKK